MTVAYKFFYLLITVALPGLIFYVLGKYTILYHLVAALVVAIAWEQISGRMRKSSY